MCCFIAAAVFALPRFTLFFLWIFTTYIGRAFHTWMWPFLGFFFMPYTTLAYAAAMNEGGGLNGIWLALFVIGVLLDFGAFGGARESRRRGGRGGGGGGSSDVGGAAHEIDHG